MPWLQLRINTSREVAPKIEFALSRVAAHAITLEDNADQPIFEPAPGETPLWSDTRVTGLFPADIDTEQLLNELEQSFSQPIENYRWHILEDKDWEREWMQHYHPLKCADNLWICPSWTEPPQENAVNVKLDPGLAFGTGTHPTTFMCLQWLAKQDISEKLIIDYGCGSGILGIAALKLGAAQCYGVDIDPQARLATRDNLERNQLNPSTFPVFPNKSLPHVSADIIMANILAGPLITLSPILRKLLKPNGSLCLSGITSAQRDLITHSYKDWLEIDQIAEVDAWICVSGHKKCV